MASKLGRWRATYQGTACPRCSKPLRHEALRSGPQNCPMCGGGFEAVRFEPAEPPVVVADLAGTGPEGAAPCVRHARNQAEIACSRCGQFMCSLCRIDADQKTYCPGCFDRLAAEGSLSSAVTRVKNYSGWATICLLASYFFMPLSVVTGPLGVFFCIKGLRDKKSRNESDGIARLYWLMVLCALTMLIGVSLVVLVFTAAARGVSR